MNTQNAQTNLASLYGQPGEAPVNLGHYAKALWQRKWLALALAVGITGLGVLYTSLTKPVYEATSLIAFTSGSTGAFRPEGNDTPTGSLVSSQIPLITRPAFLNEIARDPILALSKKEMFRNEPDIPKALAERISVTRLKDTDLLAVRMEGEDPKLITATVNLIADRQKARIESTREATTAAAVQESLKKIADMNSEMNGITQRIWARANSAAIPGLTFNEQQKDSRVIVEGFRRRTEALAAQRAEVRKELDQSIADSAAGRIQFESLCKSILAEPAPAPAAEAPAPPPAATDTAKPDAPAAPAKADEPKPVTAAQLAGLYLQQLKTESELESARALLTTQRENPYIATLEKQRDDAAAQLEVLHRQAQLQHDSAQDALGEHARVQERVAKLAERIDQINEAIETRRAMFTASAAETDAQIKQYRNQKASLESQYAAERKKLDQNLGSLPRAIAEGAKIQQVLSAASRLQGLQMMNKVLQENYDGVQKAMVVLDAPLTDVLNEYGKYERLDKDVVRLDDWVRQVKLALSQVRVRVDDAFEPNVPIRPNWRMNVAFAGLLGLMVAFGSAILLELTRKTLKTSADVRDALAAPALGVVPYFRSLDAGKSVLSLDAFKDVHVLETFNEIRFGMDAMRPGNPPKVILVTSATAGEGKSTVASMLAGGFARSGEKVLLVDANLRLPYLHAVFQTKVAPGLHEILHDRSNGQSCIRSTPVENMFLMTAGQTTEDGLAWTQPGQVAQFVSAARSAFDRIVLDSTSVIGVADVRAMAGSVDAVLYVVQADRRKRGLVARGLESLRAAKADVLGVILNNADYTKGDHYHFLKRTVTREGTGPADADSGEAGADAAAHEPGHETRDLSESMRSWTADAQKQAENPDTKDETRNN